jgi:hypothetical protein
MHWEEERCSYGFAEDGTEPNFFGEALVTSQIKDVSVNGVYETTDSGSCAMLGVELFLLYYISFPFWLRPCKGSLFLAEA